MLFGDVNFAEADNCMDNAKQRGENAMGRAVIALQDKKNDYYHNYEDFNPVAESLVDNLSSGVIFVNKAGILTFMNKKAETILHVCKESVLGKRVDMLPLRTPIYKVMSENCRDFMLEMSIMGRGIVVRTTEVISPDGTVLGEMTEINDVTAEKMEKRQREEFVAMMTHDLKSPLMVMLGYVQAIKLGMWGSVDPQIQSSIIEIERSGGNLSSMIENMLDVYRLEVGLVQINPKYSDVREILERCYRDCRLEAEDQWVNLTLSIHEEIPSMLVDSKQLARVFTNLIGNAIKFTPRNGHVAITAGVVDGNLEVLVKDTGIGISAKDISRIFNKYFRSEQAAGFKGTGLGLTISRSILEAHGGMVEVESVLGCGSTFTVKLPIKVME
jgi:signal transduction histidine kinase